MTRFYFKIFDSLMQINQKSPPLWAGIFYFLWQVSLMAQPEQPQPHDDFPAFLSLSIFATIAATIKISIRETIIVPKFAVIQAIKSSFIDTLIFDILNYSLFIFAFYHFASLYFLKKSIYIIPIKRRQAAIRPKTLTLPVKSPPNWLIMRAIT